MTTICYGIKNSHEPNLFKSFITYFSDLNFEQHIVALNYIEVPELVKKMNVPYKVVGRHYGKGRLRKALGLVANDINYILNTSRFDVSITHGNTYLIHASRMMGKPTITFTDNDINYVNHKLYFPFVDFLITPDKLSISRLVQHGAKKEKIIQYDGFKEDIYIADYKPDLDFIDNIPFDKFVTVRPEALKAVYVHGSTTSIVPELFRLLSKEQINILFLPRYESDRDYAIGYSNIYIPLRPVNGLDACYYSEAVLTGAGTFAREAACLGIPAVSFFPGEKLLTVDKKMVEDEWIFHSRNPREIVDYILSSKKRKVDLSRCKKVQSEVFGIIERLLQEI